MQLTSKSSITMSYQQLAEGQRYQISAHFAQGVSVSATAQAIVVHRESDVVMPTRRVTCLSGASASAPSSRTSARLMNARHRR